MNTPVSEFLPRITHQWKDVDELEGQSISSNKKGQITLRPGDSILKFEFCPVRSGMYRLDSLKGFIWNLPFQVKVEVRSKAFHEVILEAQSPSPRLEVMPMGTSGDYLVEGEVQWMGISITATRDELKDVNFTVEWPLNDNELMAYKETDDFHVHRKPGGQPPLCPTISTALLQDPRYSEKSIILKPKEPQESISSDPGSLSYGFPADQSLRQCIFWWRVRTGNASFTREDVRIQSPSFSMHYINDNNSQLNDSNTHESTVNTVLTSTTEVPVAIEFTDLCHRSIYSSISVPTQQPFSIRTKGKWYFLMIL